MDKPRPSQKAFDWLFGYDYFIAHRSVDGKGYASALYDALTAKGNELDCFLDVKHYGAGGGLTNMQARALRKTTRLIAIVTPHAHDADAPYLRGEVAEFRRIHPDGIIVPIGTWETLTEKDYPNSQLLPLLPHLPNDICILESAEQLGKGEPSPQTVAKLLNDFSEERRSTKRLRWIRRVAVLLLILFVAAVGFGIYASLQRKEAVRQRNEAKRQEGIAKDQTQVAKEAEQQTRLRASKADADIGLQLAGSDDEPFAFAHAVRALELNPNNSIAAILAYRLLGDGPLTLPTHLFTHTSTVRTLALSRDGRSLATGCDDGSVMVVDLETGEKFAPKDKPLASVLKLAFSPDGQSIAFATGDEASQTPAVYAWEFKTPNKPVLVSEVLGDGVLELAWPLANRIVAYAGRDWGSGGQITQVLARPVADGRLYSAWPTVPYSTSPRPTVPYPTTPRTWS